MMFRTRPSRSRPRESSITSNARCQSAIKRSKSAPKQWCQGSQQRKTSRSLTSQTAAIAVCWERALWCVNSTPFGAPVVPLVYRRNAVSLERASTLFCPTDFSRERRGTPRASSIRGRSSSTTIFSSTRDRASWCCCTAVPATATRAPESLRQWCRTSGE